MLFILLAVLCSTGVSLILKITHTRKMAVEPIFLINYVTATAASALQGDFSTLPRLTDDLGWGFYLSALFLGFLFIGAFFVYRKTIAELGISLSSTISRLSAGLPLLGTILLFHETPHLRQIIGMALMFLAIPLASEKSDDTRHKGHNFWGAVLFLAFGINDFTLKVVGELWPQASEGAFLFFVFLTSTVIALVLTLAKGHSFNPALLLPGIILGVINLGSSFFILKSLRRVDAIIVYPLLALGIIFMGLVTGMLFWKEKLTRSHAIFIAIAAVAVLLIS